MLEKLQKIMSYISKMEDYEIDGLYAVLINKDFYYLEDIDREEYSKFIKNIIENSKDDCGCGNE